MNPRREFAFTEEDVEIVVPEQARKIKPVSLPRTPLAAMPAKAGGFQPGRVVINIAFIDEDDPGTYLTELDPPVEIRVRYTRGDLQRARQAGQSLSLAFWDGSDWVVFTPKKHQFELVAAKEGEGGFGSVRLSHWGDPNMAWGP